MYRFSLIKSTVAVRGSAQRDRKGFRIYIHRHTRVHRYWCPFAAPAVCVRDTLTPLSALSFCTSLPSLAAADNSNTVQGGGGEWLWRVRAEEKGRSRHCGAEFSTPPETVRLPRECARARALSTADDGPKCPLGGRSDFQLRLRAYATECANYRITIYIITVWVELSDLAGYHKFTNNIFVK